MNMATEVKRWALGSPGLSRFNFFHVGWKLEIKRSHTHEQIDRKIPPPNQNYDRANRVQNNTVANASLTKRSADRLVFHVTALAVDLFLGQPAIAG